MNTIHIGGRSLDLDRLDGTLSTRDIASTLARTCRFNGALRDDWPVQWHSVADHSVLVAAILIRWMGLAAGAGLIGLFHDAHEALVGDIITPVKRWFGIGKQEKDLGLRVLQHLDLGDLATDDVLHAVRWADLEALRIEVFALGLPAHLFGMDSSWALSQEDRELCEELGVLQDDRALPLSEVFTRSRERFLTMESDLRGQSKRPVSKLADFNTKEKTDVSISSLFGRA
jgi:hypothetical protein